MRTTAVLPLLAFLLGVIADTPHCVAGISVYTDRDLWEDAVGNVFATEDFNAIEPFDLPDGVSNVGLFDIEVTGTENLLGPNAIIDPNITPNPLEIDGTIFFRGVSRTSAFPTLVNFPVPITGFGADWTSPSSNGKLTMEIEDTVVKFEVEAPSGGFLGVVSDAPFSRIALPTEINLIEGFGMDNVSFTPVPEPSGLITVALALVGIVLCCPFRQAHLLCPFRDPHLLVWPR